MAFIQAFGKLLRRKFFSFFIEEQHFDAHQPFAGNIADEDGDEIGGQQQDAEILVGRAGRQFEVARNAEHLAGILS